MNQGQEYGLASKRPQTIDMPDSDVVDELDKLAKEDGLSRRKYLHTHLKSHVDNEAFAKRYFKGLKRITLDEGKLFVWDSNKRITAEVGLKKGVITCNACDVSNCVHVLYTMTRDEYSQLKEF